MGVKRSGILVHICVNKPQRFVSLFLPRSRYYISVPSSIPFSFAAAACAAAGKASLGRLTDRKLMFTRLSSVPVLLPELGSLHSWTRNSAGRLGIGLHDQRGCRVASAHIYFEAPPVRYNCSLADSVVGFNTR